MDRIGGMGQDVMNRMDDNLLICLSANHIDCYFTFNVNFVQPATILFYIPISSSCFVTTKTNYCLQSFPSKFCVQGQGGVQRIPGGHCQ
jgi:hypothetical protein